MLPKEAKRRAHIEIICEILRIARKGAKKTRIVYGANLNFKLLKEILNILQKEGLIVDDGLIKTTDRGKEFISEYQDFKARFPIA